MYDHFTQKEKSDENSVRDRNTINEELNTLLEDLVKLNQEDQRRPIALKIKAKNAGLNRRYAELSKYNNQMINEYPNSTYELTSLYDEIGYQVEILNDFDKANKLLVIMKTAYPDDELTIHARILIGENVELPEQKANKDSQQFTSSEEVPAEYQLYPAYPNPSNPSSTIGFSLPENTHVMITIFNIQGRLVRNLVEDYKEAGKYSVVWDGKNETGSSVSSGLYIYVLRTMNKIIGKKVLMIR